MLSSSYLSTMLIYSAPNLDMPLSQSRSLKWSFPPGKNRTVAHQCAAKGRHKSTWKFFRSLNLMAASMYTKSIHRDTVGRQTPLSEKKEEKYVIDRELNITTA